MIGYFIDSDKYDSGKKQSMGKVSIITPVYNCENVIEETIRSVLEQTYKNWEWIICDDGSEDKTAEIIDRYAREDSRIHLIRAPHSDLPAAGRNRSLREADGDYIAFLDGDDKWHPEKLLTQVKYLKSHPGCGAVHTAYELIGDPEVVKFHTSILDFPSHEKATFDLMFQKCVVHISSVLVRREMLRSPGGFDENPLLRGVEDYDFLLRLSARVPIHHIPKPLSCYRISMGTVLHNKEYNRFEKEMALLNKMVQDGLQKNPGLIKRRKAAIYYNRGVNALFVYGGPFRKDLVRAFLLDKINAKMVITVLSLWMPYPLLKAWFKFLLKLKKSF